LAPSKPNALEQSGEATYPVCIKEDTSLKDGFVEVKFKPTPARKTRREVSSGACKDADNYYIARANALEDNGHHLPHHQKADAAKKAD